MLDRCLLDEGVKDNHQSPVVAQAHPGYKYKPTPDPRRKEEMHQVELLQQPYTQNGLGSKSHLEEGMPLTAGVCFLWPGSM